MVSPVLRSSLPLDRIVFDGEVDMRRALLEDEHFRSLIEARRAPALSARRRLLLSALRLTPEMAPAPFAALAAARERLGLNLPVELYCVAEREINAFVVPPERGVVLLGVTSEALERLDEGELGFVFGHELGHALFEHFRIAPDTVIDHEDIAPIEIVRLCAWMRYAELTADRVGLLCCDDFEVAVRAFFKLTSGLSNADYLRHAERCADQYAAVVAERLESSEQDWFSTHPYSPLRIKALDVFARSSTFHELMGRSSSRAGFHRLLGRSGRPLTEEELEREVGEIVRLMDPSFLRDAEPAAPLMREFVALVGMSVALADGRLARGEKEVLGKLVGRRGVTKAKKKLAALSAAEHAQRLDELSRQLCLGLSFLGRQKLVEDLVAVALSDNELHVAELEVIAGAAAQLDVPPAFVEQTLSRMARALD